MFVCSSRGCSFSFSCVFSVLSASPNPAHYVLAVLSIPSYLQAVAPNCTQYTLITQNVDGLSTRAYREVMSHHSQSDNTTKPTKLFRDAWAAFRHFLHLMQSPRA